MNEPNLEIATNEPKLRTAASQNACKLCAPLGACLAIRGIEGAIPILHGSQGCATYIRRYMISHYREPLDVASSSFDETATIFGGERNLIAGITNIQAKYHPSLVGVATTCLAETMGEDVRLYLNGARRHGQLPDCPVFNVSTPSYAGTHVDGFFATLYALTESFATQTERGEDVVLFSNMLSPADIRYLKTVLSEFGIRGHVVPDYSDTLDGPTWTEYQSIPEGGTPVSVLREMGNAKAALELSLSQPSERSPAGLLQAKFGVTKHVLPVPVGLRATDRLFDTLTEISGHAVPLVHAGERARLLDAYVDGHKAVFGKRAVVYGDPDLVVGLCAFLSEVGIHPVIAASGTRTQRMKTLIEESVTDPSYCPEVVCEDTDFVYLEELTKTHGADILIGNSKGYGMSKRLELPLVRVGFPIHDRLGGSRILHIGYRGAMQLFDNIANALIAHRQDSNDIGYTYM